MLGTMRIQPQRCQTLSWFRCHLIATHVRVYWALDCACCVYCPHTLSVHPCKHGQQQWYVQGWFLLVTMHLALCARLVFAGDNAPRVVCKAGFCWWRCTSRCVLFELFVRRNLEVADNAASRGGPRHCRGGLPALWRHSTEETS